MKNKILRPNPDVYASLKDIRSDFSFGPFIRFLKNKVAAKPGFSPELYTYIISRFEKHDELIKPIRDISLLEQHHDLLQLAASSLFSITSTMENEYYHISSPYLFEIVYQSHPHNSYFEQDGAGFIIFNKELSYELLQYEQLFLAYRLILKKYYRHGLAGAERNAYPLLREGDNTSKYFRIFLDESFIDVHLQGELPPFPTGAIAPSSMIHDMTLLRELLPLNLFHFEGFLLRRVSDITYEQSVTDVKNALIEMHTDESVGYEKLQLAAATLLMHRDAEISIIPFVTLNEKFILSEQYASRSILLRRVNKEEEKEQLYNRLGNILKENGIEVLFDNIPGMSGNSLLERNVSNIPFSKFLIRAIVDKQQLIGMIEIAFNSTDSKEQVLQRIKAIEPYLVLAMRSSIRHFHSMLDKVVKENFTAIQPSVEWKFAEQAWKYIRGLEKNISANLETLTFDEVYPLYGIIDIRNSSSERSRCIQNDLLSQLQYIEETILSMKRFTKLEENEYLNNLLFKNKTMKERVMDVLLAEDEMRVNEYLEHEIKSLFRHFSHDKIEIEKIAHEYLHSVDTVRGHLYRNRRDFDETLDTINSAISRYLEAEENKIQRFYPHYFEKFKSDGFEYNIFIGESIAKNKPFDYLYLKNLRLWQLSSMVDITRMTSELLPTLKIPLQTTQLILAHSNPISITFRKDERKFDVEGGANIRYEVIKKRIDKVKIRETGERLTQPGKIAIVYTQIKESEEYEEYIHYLTRKNLLEDDVEKLELEEVQGISGLKAIRVSVKMN